MCPFRKKKIKQTHFMDEKLFKILIREIDSQSKKTKKHHYISLSLQNEPFLDNKLVDRIKYIKQHKYLEVLLTTNGSFLNKELISKLEISGIDSINISMDSIRKKTFQKIRKGLDYDVLMNNIKLVSKSKLKNKTSILVVVQKQNLSELKQTTVYFKKLGLKPKVVFLINRAGSLDNFDILKGNYKRKEIIRDFSVLNPQNNCAHLINNISILYNGDIIKCCHDWDGKYIIGNVEKNSIKQVWDSKKYKLYRLLRLKNKLSLIKGCKCCSYNMNKHSNLGNLVQLLKIVKFLLLQKYKKRFNI